MTKSEALTTQNLGHTVNTSEGPLTILKGINLEIKQGESVAIVGASGSGKSTLLGLIAGLDRHTSGEIYLQGHALSSLDEEARADLRSQYVGFVFQSFHLLPSLSALENVMLPAELKGDPSARDAAIELLTKVGLDHRLNHYPRQLSGGEQQRVAIARAFASNAKILFADEPTGNLDSKNGVLVSDLLFSLNKDKGTTLIMVTHDSKLAERCDRFVEIDAGELKGS
ncbi:ABC transporter ATP-binding protein [Marinomonas mediterranea]|jgi:Predicted ABC-type transport system involved in lysophospholipase L1 biosynthesis, ATPase component|uniref:Phosphonate-transporting ATPase n=1 Tax=Marinomonas mediterranea (strain ATCC 700492 / JCM 21426 / NBRC 103028 / MMB-1) TaxID=717774 RepID=F2K442_MARM1|nr:ABC transporter ATP-binding protein [Marinomonas mediterranea]ADZ91384.1 Phosphonate-transporting ATPase [Marinomonas mediterranea MMB-1]WCN09357.1 ATP-binding cassette domain-containing protein [Marinomonas mediterranea]WCN13434.1 ATP-binding cassette domain-containing protein [Marinomonas mediterranea]WCN17500.1 ATP-binding cassette domain-containing protein [Marinomonas mediterranea MMB-1]